MTIESVLEELEKRGIKAEKTTVSKNNVEMQGIRIYGQKEGEMVISPIIYWDSLFSFAETNNMSLDQVIDTIIRISENPEITFPIDLMEDHNFVLQHLRIALQRKTREEIVKRDIFLPEIESYLLVITKNCSIKITNSILKKIGISEREAWEIAMKNTLRETQFLSMSDFFPDAINQYILTTKDPYKGASAVLNKNILSRIGKELDTDNLVLLPSSIHEFIVMKLPEFIGDDTVLSDMVKNVNNGHVFPEEQLCDHAFLYSISSDKIKML